jgi:predicted DNA-binding ribbon-helix-helix protein
MASSYLSIKCCLTISVFRDVIQLEMQTHTVKTTLTFTPSFFQRLRTIAHAQRLSMSRFVEAELDALFHEWERKKNKRLYQALDKWQGTGSQHITDGSTTINETLYGEHGAWKGQRE